MLYAFKRLALGLGLIVLASAILLFTDRGGRRSTTVLASAPGQPLSKKWHLGFIELNRVLDVEEAEAGVLEGLRDAGLVEGRDFEKTIRNAQGDMATVNGLIDAAVADSDLLITFSTPTLQAAMQRAQNLPIVFTYVADAIAAGAGTSDTSHRPNVTGVYMLPAYDAMLPLIRSYLPNVRVLGTVYVPAEVNMVSQLKVMEKAVKAAGMELKVMAANSSADVGDAAMALVASHVDAICQLPGNLTAAAFPSISLVSRQSRVPVFAFQSSQVRAGAVLAVARDYHASGADAAKLAARIMRGESPAAIPLISFAKTRLVVNPGAARALGLEPPALVMQRADEIVK